jgi:nucleotide-binding universal stress UspA family protein
VGGRDDGADRGRRLTSGPILIGFDGSRGAEHAIAQAGPLLAPAPAVVVHVWLPLSHALLWNPLIEGAGPLAEQAEMLDEQGRTAAAALAEAGAELARDAGLPATARLAETRHGIWRVLLACADEYDARLIVIGSHGISAVAGLLGSVAAGVVHHARRPVFVVPEPPGR